MEIAWHPPTDKRARLCRYCGARVAIAVHQNIFVFHLVAFCVVSIGHRFRVSKYVVKERSAVAALAAVTAQGDSKNEKK